MVALLMTDSAALWPALPPALLMSGAALPPALPMVLTLLQCGLFLLLLAGCVHLLRSAAWALSQPPLVPGPLPPLPDDPPTVTVALPIRNERFVAERVLQAACALDWPAAQLEIQVLDDSDDDTSQILDQAARRLRAAGHDVKVVRRADRRGYKAGNLQNGLGQCRGDYIAVLDADSVPPPDFLRRLLPPLLRDPGLAFCQGRWAFDNEAHSLLTRLQGLILHGLMTIEQARLSAAGLPLSFNGSGGVFRKSALLAIGGWQARGDDTSVAEDLDLSYRARLSGLRGLHLATVATTTELPATMAAFRVQQARWVRGGGQVLRGMGRHILRGALPPREVLTMLGHLLRHARQPYLVLLLLWLPLTATGALRPAIALPFDGLLVTCLLAIAAYYGAALRRLGRAPLAAALLAPALIWLSLGLSLCLSDALLRGVLGGPAEFVRTPKTGQNQPAGQTYRAPRSRLAWVEVALGAILLGAGAVTVARHDLSTALFLWTFAAPGLLWVGYGSLR